MIALRRNGTVARRGFLTRRHSLWKAADGSVATEYGLIAALIVVAIILSLSQVRTNLLSLPFPSLIDAFSGSTDE